MTTVQMADSETASNQLLAMINDSDARTLFAKAGPLSWFSLEKTYTSAYRRGSLTERQVPLVLSVYRQYTKFKAASQKFAATGKSREIASALYRILHEKPKVASQEDRSRSQRLSHIVRAFHDGVMVHIGHFNDAESLMGELPVENRIAMWELIHSARREYLAKLYGLD